MNREPITDGVPRLLSVQTLDSWLDQNHHLVQPAESQWARTTLSPDQLAASTPGKWEGSRPINFDGGRVRAWLGVQSPVGRSSCSRAVQTDWVGEYFTSPSPSISASFCFGPGAISLQTATSSFYVFFFFFSSSQNLLLNFGHRQSNKQICYVYDHYCNNGLNLYCGCQEIRGRLTEKIQNKANEQTK